MNIFVISDTHFCHKNIIDYCNRPFVSVEEMNEVLINNWNSVVSPTDTVYHLGDFGIGNKSQLKEIFNSLNGNKILVVGNHDRRSKITSFSWSLKTDLYTITVDEMPFVLCHYPMLSWDRQHYGSIHLYGHIHNQEPVYKVKNSFNISADVINFTPKNIKEFI